MSKSDVRWRTKVSSSWKEPGSSSFSTRSRAVSLPLSCCFSTACSEAEWTAASRSSCSWASFSSYVSGTFWRMRAGIVRRIESRPRVLGPTMPRVSLTALLLAAWCLAAPCGTAAYTPREHALYGDGPSGRYLLGSGWRTRADQHNTGLREGWQRPGHGAGFRRVTIPNCFNARDHTAAGERSRVQWYRERFNLPDSSGATGWRIRFESVNVRADVWLNGRRLGSHVGAHLPFELDARGARRGGN